MAATADGLRAKIAKAEARVARLRAIISAPTDGDRVASAFHLGTVGGSGRNVVRLNARKGASLDRIIDAAVDLPKAEAYASRLRARLATLEGPPATKPPARAALDRALVARFRDAKVGSEVYIDAMWRTAIVERKSRLSLRAEGLTWSIAEVTGLHANTARAVLEELEAEEREAEERETNT